MQSWSALLSALTGFLLYAAIEPSPEVLDAGEKGFWNQIPLNRIYTTSEQEGLKQLKRDNKGPLGKALDNLVLKAGANGASSVFLIRAEEIKDALDGTTLVFGAGYSVEKPVVAKSAYKGNHYWMVVYFGIAGSGKAWIVDSVHQRDNILRMNYKRGSTEASDLHHYFCWVPVGELPKGTLRLELYRTDQMLSSLSRSILIQD